MMFCALLFDTIYVKYYFQTLNTADKKTLTEAPVLNRSFGYVSSLDIAVGIAASWDKAAPKSGQSIRKRSWAELI
jgi:hypothetical protein